MFLCFLDYARWTCVLRPLRCAFLLDLFQLGLCVDWHLGMCDRVKIIISVLQFTASVYGVVHALVPMWLLPFPSTFWLVYNFVLFYGIQCFSLCFLDFRELDFYYLNFEKKTGTIVTRFFVACFFLLKVILLNKRERNYFVHIAIAT